MQPGRMHATQMLREEVFAVEVVGNPTGRIVAMVTARFLVVLPAVVVGSLIVDVALVHVAAVKA